MDEEQPAELARRGWRYALTLTGDRAAADDLVQEAWVSVLAAGGPLTRGYLLRAIRCRWIDAWRRRGDVVPLPVEGLSTPPRGPRRIEAAQQLSVAFSALREEEREALHLCVVEGYTAAEAGALTDRPRNTILSLLHRGRAKLKDALNEADREVLP